MRWTTVVVVYVVAFTAVAGVLIKVDDSVRFQEFLGVGGSLTDSSAWLLSDVRSAGDTTPVLSPTQRATLLADLFDAGKGIGLSVLRQPMGTSDFR